MAVQTWIYGKPEIRYEGCVLNTWERNGAWDSDFYATCWDAERGEIVEVEYDTTRAGGGGWATVDATEDTLRAVYRYHYDSARAYFDNVLNEKQAKEYAKGDEVRVVKGRKVKVGTVGKCFWRGTCYNRYSRTNEDRVGIEVNGDRFFLAAENVENAGWEARLMTGKERKEKIRNCAVNSMPYRFRGLFNPEEWWRCKHYHKPVRYVGQ